MKFGIKHRWSGAVLFSLETDRLKLCVEAAVKSSADLSSADLRGADLGGANLRGADLGGAKLRADSGDELTTIGDVFDARDALSEALKPWREARAALEPKP